jgi:hypothetical protein
MNFNLAIPLLLLDRDGQHINQSINQHNNDADRPESSLLECHPITSEDNLQQHSFREISQFID